MKQRRSMTFLLLLLWLIQSYTIPLAAAPVQPAVVQKSLQVLAATHTINITDNGFNPAILTIKTGESIRWQNTTGQSQTVRSGPPPRILLPLVLLNAEEEVAGASVRRSAFVPTNQFEGIVQPGQNFEQSFNFSFR